ncbi:hypothetical protein V8E54_005476 [Elaphomyces granulatus]
MAFNIGASAVGGTAQAELGPQLPEITTMEVGFKGVDRDCRVRFLPNAWPADALPPPTCSLLAVAPNQGIVVAGGPDCLVVSTTKSVRDAISAKTDKGVKVKPFEPQAKIPMVKRPMQVAFCSAESALALSTAESNQLLIYETSTLLQENPQPKLFIPTNAPLRALAPNPAPLDNSNSTFVAMTTVAGSLLIADLRIGSLVSGPNGPVLKDGVSCISWSNKGKQLVAGLADGTCYQMTPEGVRKDEIPRPPDLDAKQHVSSIAWLEVNEFLIVYTPSYEEDDMRQIPTSNYYIVQRRQQFSFLFRKLPEICSPFGLKRSPAYQFIARFRDFKPHLKDALIVSSTASTDVGLVTRSDQAPTDSAPANQLKGMFASTAVAEEIRTATLPMTDAGVETSTIGLGIDLSSGETVESPILNEDIAESSTPLPNILLLTNDGILVSWWFIYSDSVRQKLPYHALSVYKQQQQQEQKLPFESQVQQHAFTQPTPTGQPTLGPPSAPSFGTPSALGSTRQPAFGATSALGSNPSTGSTFGSTSMLGQNNQQRGFGAIQSSGASFGQPSLPGQGFGGLASGSGFGVSPAGGGFSAFASSGGFANLATSKPAGESPFSKPGQSLLSSEMDTTTSFGSPQKHEDSKASSSTGPSGFVLGSVFKRDDRAAADQPRPDQGTGAFSISSSMFDDMISTPSNKLSPLVDVMDDMEDEPSAPPIPKSSFSGQASLSAEKAIPLGVKQSNAETPLSTSQPTTAFRPNFTAKSQTILPSSSSSSEQAVVPSLSEGKWMNSAKTPAEPPLPPDATSKARYSPGDSSSSSNVSKSSVEDVPLPPDFLPSTTPQVSSVVEDAPLPPADFLPSTTPQVPSVVEDAPLPPDFLTSTKKNPTVSDQNLAGNVPLPSNHHSPPKETVPPPDFLTSTKKNPTVSDQNLAGNVPLPSNHHSPPKETVPPPDFLTSTKKNPTVSDQNLAGNVPLPSNHHSRRDLLGRENARSSSAPGGPGRSITIKPNERLVTTELPKVEEPAFKPGIPGQIERLYCDINSMIGTLGINSRALSSFLLYQGTSKEPNFGRWAEILRGDHPQGILDEKIVLADMDKLNECVEMLSRDLQQQRLQKVHKKLEQCQQLLSRDIFNLRGQCASLQKIIDMHADTAAVLSAPLSAEQANLQQELRKSSATVQSKLADLEQGITFLRAKIADKVTSDGAANGTSSAKQSMKKPTVAAVTDTIDRMTKMAESKSSDIDVLEAQMRKLGLDVSGARGSREGTPFTTPLKQSTGRLPITPGSFGSPSGHTPESGKLLHSSVHRTTKPNLSRSIRGGVDMLTREDCERWKEKARRRKEVLRNLKEVLAGRKVVVREWADS